MTADQEPNEGWTKFWNWLLDALISGGFSKRELLVLLLVVRQTYGYNKPADDLTTTQVAKATGIDQSHASATIRKLLSSGILIEGKKARYGRSLRIESDLGKWRGRPKQPSRPKQPKAKTANNVGQNGLKRRPNRPAPRAETAYTKDNPKRQSQKTTPKERERARPTSDPTKPKSWKRLPADWFPPADEAEKMRAKFPGVDLELELETLRDHEFKDRKTDPLACWRNWIRKAAQFNRSGPPSGKTIDPDGWSAAGRATLDAGLRIIQELEDEDEQQASRH